MFEKQYQFSDIDKFLHFSQTALKRQIALPNNILLSGNNNNIRIAVTGIRLATFTNL